MMIFLLLIVTVKFIALSFPHSATAGSQNMPERYTNLSGNLILLCYARCCPSVKLIAKFQFSILLATTSELSKLSWTFKSPINSCILSDFSNLNSATQNKHFKTLLKLSRIANNDAPCAVACCHSSCGKASEACHASNTLWRAFYVQTSDAVPTISSSLEGYLNSSCSNVASTIIIAWKHICLGREWEGEDDDAISICWQKFYYFVVCSPAKVNCRAMSETNFRSLLHFLSFISRLY